MEENKLLKYFIISTFVTLYVLVSIISTIHVIDFFRLSNPDWLAITLAIAFEVGAAASLASIIALRKMNRGIVWVLFFVLTAMQAMGNAYYAYIHLNNYQSWIELFGLVDEDVISQKRILSIVSGAILPLVALGFIKSLVDYMKPDELNLVVDDNIETTQETIIDNEENKDNVVDKIREENVKLYNKQNQQQVEEIPNELIYAPKDDELTEIDTQTLETPVDVNTIESEIQSDEKKN